ncbi:hypothetical protein ABFG93_21455 (plasmid) [Pseudalkalibacillus hwajinpoensis]|uniref:hypothetical protein n=1 Tax=Guptibacillus hwajinpoensis TaxID=208199 RepID=UPI00325B5870
MEQKVLGISLHVAGDGLQYFIHFNDVGTIQVSQKAYDQAYQELTHHQKAI